MSEPNQTATEIHALSGRIRHWYLNDSRINSRSDAYAMFTSEGWILVDPLPLELDLLSSLKPVRLILLTARCHQRSSWRFRKLLGCPVFAPAYNADNWEPINPPDGEGLVEPPDFYYSCSAELPEGFSLTYTPGPCDPHYAIEVNDGCDHSLLTGDLVLNLPGAGPQVMPGEWQEDPHRALRSVGNLAAHNPTKILPAHGEPIVERACEVLATLRLSALSALSQSQHPSGQRV